MKSIINFLKGTILFFVIVTVFSTCQKENMFIGDNNNYNGGIVYVIDAETITANLESISEDGTLIFSSLPSNKTPKANDIICCAPAGKAPRGFLYRVTNITQKDGKIVIQTKEVSLEETIERADVKETINLDDHIVGVFDENGNPLQYKSGSKGTTKIGIKLTVQGIGIEGSIEINNKLDFEMNIDGWNLQYMKFAYTGETELKASIIGELQGKIPLGFIPIATIKLAPITIMAGVVPVVITPEIPIILSGELNGKLKGKFTLFDNKYSITAGVKYENKEVKGIFETNNPPNNLSLLDRLNVALSGEFKTTVEPGVSFLLYNSSGVSVGATLGIYGKATLTLGDNNVAQIIENLADHSRYNINPKLTISAGVEVGVQGKLKIFAVKLIDYKATMTICEKELLRGSVFPQFADISLSNIIPNNSATASTTINTPADFNFIFPVSEHGICLSQNIFPNITNSISCNSLGVLPAFWTPINAPKLTANLTNLQPNKTYYVCTYFTNIFGTFYGKIKSFNSNNDGLTQDIHDLIPDDILEKIYELGIEINGGNNPPDIEGTYIVSPLTIENSNFNYAPPGTIYWIGDGKMNVKFSEQNNTKLTVKLDYWLGNGEEESGYGLGSFITGDGNKFSLFVEIKGTQNGLPFKCVQVHSGEIVENCIRNYHHVEIETEANPYTIQVGQGVLFKDGDGVSEKY